MAGNGGDQDSEEERPLLARASTYGSIEPQVHDEIEPIPISPLRGTFIAAAIFLLIFILTSNVSLITTIQSPIAIDLKATSEVSWFTSSYLIAVTSITPVSGKLSQIFTPRIYLFSSILIQAAGLLLTSLAPSLAIFLAGRVICGIGSAAVTPVAFILVTELISKKRRGLFFGFINTGYTTGVACGAILAGALEPVIGWRAVFWIQIPVTLIAAIVALLGIPKHGPMNTSKEDLSILKKLARIDYFGMITLIVSLVLLLFALSALKVKVTPVALAVGTLILFVFVEAKWAVDPIVPIKVLKSRANILSGISVMGSMSARWGVLFYVPVYGIAVRGWSPSAAGALLIPTNAGFALGSIVIGLVHIRRAGSYYLPTLICFASFALVHFCVSQLLTTDSTMWIFTLCLFFNGFIVGGLLVYSLAHLLHLTPIDLHFIVIPFNTTFRSFAGSFGSALSGGFFLRTLQHNLTRGFKDVGLKNKKTLIQQLLGRPQLVQKLDGIEKQVAIQGYSDALKQTFLAGVGLVVIMMVLQAGVGWTAPTETEENESNSRNAVDRRESR